MAELVVRSAFYIGYSVMILGGILLTLGALWFVADACWRAYCNGMNMGELYEAVSEWKKNHPEKALRQEKRNG